MATRFYFTGTAEAAPVNPTINAGGEWTHIGPTVARPFHRAPAGSSSVLTSVGLQPDSGADHLVNGNTLVRQYVSTDRLQAQTIAAQIVKWQFMAGQFHNNDNLFVAIKIFICSEDGATIKETLLALRRDTTELTVISTYTNRGDSATIASATVEEGDRLVIEIGAGGTPASGGGIQGHNCGLWFGEAAASGDLPENDTLSTTGTPTHRPWLEFANDLLFVGDVVPKLADYSAGGAVTDEGSKATSGAASVTGGGAVVASGAKQASGVASTSAGGAVTAAGNPFIDVRFGASSVSGGAALTETGSKIASAQASVTAGALVTETGTKAAFAIADYTAGGVVTDIGNAVVVTGGNIKAWTGSAWKDCPVKVWTGSAWVQKPVKVYNGSTWVLS